MHPHEYIDDIVVPSFLYISKKEFLSKINYLYDMLETCSLCPRKCGAKRLKGEQGLCGAKDRLVIASYNLHLGEEPPISGTYGSGAVFFSGCPLKCKFCQNYPISRFLAGKPYTPYELSRTMLKLQKMGAHNINLVTSTHFMPYVVEAIYFAKEGGLNIPIIYNSSGYESEELLNALSGTIDIYLPDIKYCDNSLALRLSGVSDYVEANRKALKIMYDQVQELKIDLNGIAVKGMLIRHLVLPEMLSGYRQSFKFIAENISKNVQVSLMSQYFPAYKAFNDKRVNRKITYEEYMDAIASLEEAGLTGYYQDNFLMLKEACCR
jgi:putative pyruvate formate lyase activating enzyme